MPLAGYLGSSAIVNALRDPVLRDLKLVSGSAQNNYEAALVNYDGSPITSGPLLVAFNADGTIEADAKLQGYPELELECIFGPTVVNGDVAWILQMSNDAGGPDLLMQFIFNSATILNLKTSGMAGAVMTKNIGQTTMTFGAVYLNLQS